MKKAIAIAALIAFNSSPAFAGEHLRRVVKFAYAPVIVVGMTAGVVALSAANLAAAVVIAPFAAVRYSYRYAVEDMSLVDAVNP